MVKSKYEKLKADSQRSFNSIDSALKERALVTKEAKRVSQVAQHAHIITGDIETKFKQATKLNQFDMTFLFVATSLQLLRQYILQPWMKEYIQKNKPTDKEASKHAKEIEKKFGIQEKTGSKRSVKEYYPTLAHIITNPVPFDVLRHKIEGFDRNLRGGHYHRNATLGHDPLLGWIFGTANISTQTATLNPFPYKTYFVKKDNQGKRGPQDFLAPGDASTVKILNKTFIEDIDQNNFDILGVSLLKEALHLYSDVGSKKGLPLPIVNSVSEKLGTELTKHSLDIVNVGAQAGLATGINLLVAMIHQLFKKQEGEMSTNLYKIKTQKILTYSNTIAASSNAAYVIFSQDVSKLDMGGIIVAIYQLVKNSKLKTEVLEEFMKNEWYDIVMNDGIYNKIRE